MCFVAVAFWNMLGAGVFGFMINPPISLYYVQGLNTTPLHAHAALFGVYGFLALGFSLMVLRYVRPQMAFSEGLMRTAFWCLNGGLVLMIATSLLPIGILQFHASVSEGLWWARSEAFMQQPLLETLRWVRTFGDVVFIVRGAGHGMAGGEGGAGPIRPGTHHPGLQPRHPCQITTQQRAPCWIGGCTPHKEALCRSTNSSTSTSTSCAA